MKSKITYTNAGVNYNSVDPVKILAQQEAKKTSLNSNINIIEESRGESAFVWEEENSYKAFVIEGLGTKNLIADELSKTTGKTYYDSLAKDCVAMIVNDLIVVGAKPQIINAYFAAGSSEWFDNEKKAIDLTKGWADACKIAGAVWGGGESPVLKDIVNQETIDLAGSAIGIISPKQRLTLGDKLQNRDCILLIESSGIHANGLTMIREINKNLPQGYNTKLADGSSFGETLLTPTHIYVNLVQDLFKAEIDIHYMVNVTGHGWRKLMRAKQDFTYSITETPPIPEIFNFIQEKSGSSDEDMYGYFNMGAGFAIMLPSKHVKMAQEIAEKNNFKSWNAGIVEEGQKQVIIKPKDIIFKGETLNLR